MKWRGRLGWVVLGPAEDRVARYLEAATRHGLVTLPTSRLVEDLALARSEAYRITRQLRTLGLFGIENDQGGAKGGRRIWRTSTPDGSKLEAVAHRLAWGRVVAWLKVRRARILAAARRNQTTVRLGPLARGHAATQPAPATWVRTHPAGAGPPSPLEAAMRRFAPLLAAAWDANPARAPRGWRPSNV